MIKIITVGKIKENYFKDAIEEYTKRISKYTKLEIIEVKDFGLKEIDKVLKLEEEEILKHIDSKDYLITMEIDGKNLTSPEFASMLDELFIRYSNITFVIGGSYGISDNIKNMANYHLSFSKMTFPHQLFRIILLEQIYRSFKINNGENYHK